MAQTNRYALLSVANKDGIVEFAQGLVDLGWSIRASGGTATTLMDANVPVRDVAEMVGGGAILGHKVVTMPACWQIRTIRRTSQRWNGSACPSSTSCA
jgi:AICAR transformylase/IMP cyclohydrolase PurH